MALAPHWFAGLRARLLWVLVPVLIGLFLLDSWRDHVSLERELQHAYDQSLLEPAQALSDSLGWDANGAVSLTESFAIVSMFEAVSSRHKYLRVERQLPDGTQPQVLLGPLQFPAPPADPHMPIRPFRAAADDTRVFYHATVDHQPVRVAALLRIVHDRAGQEWRVLIQAAQGTASIGRSLHQLMWDALLRDARTLLVLVLVVWFGIGWGLRPLRALRSAIRERAPDDLQPLATGTVPAEVRPVVDAMNLHLAQQRDALEAQRQFLADASHQLRTPLAILSTQAGYALRESDPAAVQATVRSMVQQLQRSRRVAEQLLALAHASQAPPAAHAPPALCDANAVARKVVLAHLPLALEKRQDLGWLDARGEGFDEDGEDGDAPTSRYVAPVRAQASALFELLANLVHNAIVYTPAGGCVGVSVQLALGQVRITVQDNGPGIAPADREKAFERFQRLQPDAGASPSGSGLGLSIARAYAQRMHGSVQLLDGEGGQGLCVLVVLPLAA